MHLKIVLSNLKAKLNENELGLLLTLQSRSEMIEISLCFLFVQEEKVDIGNHYNLLRTVVEIFIVLPHVKIK